MSDKKIMGMGYKTIAQILIIAVLALFLAYNAGKMSGEENIGGTTTASASEIIPTGTPKAYGEDLGISYDDVSPNNPSKADTTIRVMSNLDRTITLSGSNLQRYINIAGQISCEYCCGAESIIFRDGRPACGCAHSYAMRGLAKYLIINHPEMSDNEILSELGKWKVLFFPGIHEKKAQILEASGIDSANYINLASNKYRGIEQGKASGEMVGGC